MAWISGLAGKAEEVLNNIDRSTAAVLKKDKSGDPLLEVKSVTSSFDFGTDSNFAIDSGFIRILDGKSTLEDKPKKMVLTIPSSPARKNNTVGLETQSLEWLDKSALERTTQNQKVSAKANVDSINVNQDSQANESVDSEQEKLEEFLSEKENTKSDKDVQMQADLQKEISSLQERLSFFKSERTRFLREISDLTSSLEKSRSDLSSIESELEQHRARALKTLQERDKLISELRNNPGSELDDTSVLVEINQLRQEREVLREENRQIREKLRQARQECIDADLNAEKIRQRAMEASIQARETVANERRRRMDAEEDAKLRSEEVNSLREELTLRQNAFSTKLQKQESEISRLRSQISAIGTPNSEVESRLANLTRTLVLKQQELEHLTTDRNALRLQLEKIEHEYQSWRKNITYNSVNDTDDVKALLPSFLIESPFDTGVARRVKRAYSTFDAVGIRIGVFLRRYPLARSFVLIYMAVLQLWVILILFSQSPEAH